MQNTALPNANTKPVALWMQQYTKTFARTQVVIALVTAFVHFRIYGTWALTLPFFFVLQGAALAGALWGSRLKRRFDPHAR